MNKNLKKKIQIGSAVFLAAVIGYSAWQIYVPRSFDANKVVFYNAQAGVSGAHIASDLKNSGVIANRFFFNLYAFISGNRSNLQAGFYDVSPSMSIAAIVGRLAKGDIARNKITVIEGWDINDIARHLEARKIYTKKDFLEAAKKDYSKEFAFLAGRPTEIGLEGFMFPDTYFVPMTASPEDFVRQMIASFNARLTPELRKKIAADKRSIFQIVTMASILEKEVPSLEDKKLVAGILWKRVANGMPLQIDSTINYVTGKSAVRTAYKDLQVDSKYNTYKYKGLPYGPISNPGISSIIAAIYPTKSEYWFYLSANDTGKTIFSKTYRDHAVAIARYLD